MSKPSDPALWKRVREKVRASSEGGAPGTWTSRKAVRARIAFKARGGKWGKTKPPEPSPSRSGS